MQYTNLIWRDGQPYSELFDDIYYSSDEDEAVSGENEFQHVFFRHNGLPERWRDRHKFVIAELGFGSGLNCVLTIRAWLKHCAEYGEDKTLHYIAIEKYPLSTDAITELLGRYSELEPFYEELVEVYPPAVEATHIRRLFDGRVVVHFMFMDACDALRDDMLNVDAWFLDGFSPAKNPEMWSQDLFFCIARNSHNGATCSTYTAAGQVRRNLEGAGFQVKKVSGHGNKREMLIAELTVTGSDDSASVSLRYQDKPWFEPLSINAVAEKNATIIGAGIAGLSMAYTLIQRGWTVTLIDSHGDIAKQTSSNPAPIVYPRLSADNDSDMAFYTAAYCYALHVFKTLQKKSQDKFWFDDGLLQLMDKKRISKIIRKYGLNSDFICVDETYAAGEGQVAVSYTSAGVVLPAILCDVLKHECGDSLDIIQAKVTNIHYAEKCWRCSSDDSLIKESGILIIANGREINELGLSLSFPVSAIRGQVAILKHNKKSRQIIKTLNAEVHVTPSINGRHYLGATYTTGSDDPAVSENDNRQLLQSLDEMYPGVFSEGDCSDAWVGFRTVTKDRVPIAGAVPDESFFESEYADICHGDRSKVYKPARYLNGLYISAGHGSRGFTSSFLCAEIIASQVTGEPSPVSKKIRNYLSPSRFIVNDLKRR